MTMRSLFLSFLALAGLPAYAQTQAGDDDGAWNEYTIMPSHYPADAPRFEAYPAKVYRGPNAPVRWRADPESRMFRTNLKKWGKAKPNFAGHYILAGWGCGTDCAQIAIIDARTGKVFHPDAAGTAVTVNVHDDFWRNDETPLRYRKDSRLLVLIGMPNEDASQRGISFYLWEPPKLRLIRRVPVGWYPDTPGQVQP